MKKHLSIILFLLVGFVGYAQKRNEKSIALRGPITPFDQNYTNYKSYTLKLNVPVMFESTVRKAGGTYTPSWADDLQIYGLKNDTDGDFKIAYNVTKFAFLEQKTISRSPAYVMGIEANLEIKDKAGKIIYQRYITPKVNTYLVDNQIQPAQVINVILINSFKQLVNDFNQYFLYGPVLVGRYVELAKLPKNSNLEDFNLSAQVFANISGVSRDQWPNLFGEAQKYWESLLKYQTKDNDATQEVRMGAAKNLAFSHLLLGNLPLAEKYAAMVKEDNGKLFSLSVALTTPPIADNIKAVKDYTTDSKEAKNISPISPAPVLPEYNKTSDAFKYVSIQGELIDKKNDRFVGNIKLMNDNPPIIDYRQNAQEGGIGGMAIASGLLSALKTDNSTVYIEVAGEKKPVKRKIDDISSIKTKDGKTYVVGVVGDFLQDNNHYALLEEIKSHPGLSVFDEVFPQSERALKKPKEDKYYQLPTIAVKKSLKSYFANCPAMQKRIDAGEFSSLTPQNYIQIFEAYSASCGKK